MGRICLLSFFFNFAYMGSSVHLKSLAYFYDIMIVRSGHFYIDMYYKHGANLTYLAPPRQFFMGAKSFIGTPEMQRFLSSKINLFAL